MNLRLLRRFLGSIFLVGLVPLLSFAQLPAGVTAGVSVEGVHEYRLANGLKILLIPDASQPKVTVNCTIFVGSRHEGYGETGMAHLLEHMVFKGCPKFPNVPKSLSDHGANFNGTTWLDRTNYFETMNATDDNLEFGIELEADRLMNSFIRREDLMSEFSVVRNEFEAGENRAEAILSQRMMAVAYEWHNYGKSTIGNKTDIERVPIENLQAFYRKYYRPDNAMLIIAGKFETPKALAFIVKHFGPLKNPSEPIPVTYTEEPAQDGERLVTLRRVGSVGATGAVYHIPAGRHPDYAACEVLEGVLTNAPGGRVYKALVESKLASRIMGEISPLHDPGFLGIGAQTEPEKTEEARRVLVETLESIAKTPVTDEEVERVRRQLLQGREQLLANSQRFCIELSEWSAAGDWRLFFLHRDRIEKVTAKDVNAVAAKYLIRSNRTVGIYIPTKSPERAEIPATPEIAGLLKDYKGRTALASGEAFDPTPENVEKRVQRGKLTDGLTYAFLPKKTRGETVNLSMTLRFGNEESLKGFVPASAMIGPLMARGTESKSRQQLQDELDKLKTTLSVNSGPGAIVITIQTKKLQLAGALAILSDILRHPSFPQKEFDILKRESLERLESGRTEPQQLAITALRRKLTPFPADDVRYIPTIEEDISRTSATTRDMVVALYQAQLQGAHGELAVVGDFDPAEVASALTPVLTGWTSKTPYRRIPQVVSAVAGSRETINTPDKANALYVAGQALALQDTDPDYAAFMLGNFLLGEAPLNSRLSNRVRGKDGLSYGTMSMAGASNLDKAGQFIVVSIMNPKNMGKVDAAIDEEVNKFIKEGVSASEVEEAKKGYLATLKERRAADASLARMLAQGLQANRSFTYYADLERQIEKLQPADLKKAFDRLIDPKKFVIVQAGDLAPKAEKK